MNRKISDDIEIYGRVLDRTRLAIRFHIAFLQPRGVPDEAIGLRLWFPVRSCVLFRDSTGQVVLSVSRSFLLEKIAEAGTRRDHIRRVA